MSEDFFKKIYRSLYLKGCVWEGAGDRTELQHIDPHSYGHQRCVFLVLQGRSTEGPSAHSAGCGLSLLLLSPTGLQTHRLPVFTELYNSSIAHSISLEWHVWSSSSRNNCHAVHRSLSSSASVYDCIMGFYLVPYCQPSPPTRFLPITAIGMCHFLPVHHFGMACLAGLKVNIQHIDRTWTGNTTWSYSNEGVIPHSSALQNWSLTIVCSLVSYPGHSFWVVLALCWW